MDTILDVDLSAAAGPKYQALADAVRAAIRGGRLTPGEKMPPVRELAWQLKVTPGTVARAYQKLTDAEVLTAHVGRGTFVTAAAAPVPVVETASVPAGVLDMRSPSLPDVGQVALIRSALRATADLSADALLDYADQASDRATRQAVLNRIESFDRASLTPDHVVMASGGQHAFTLILSCILHGANPVVLTEELAYTGFRHAVRLARAQMVPIEQDQDGPVPASIRAACEAHDVQVLVTSSHAHNPTAISTPPERRRQITELARLYDFQIVDDQSYSLIRNDRPSYRDLAPERTWFISSMSKSISPALRIGWFVTPNGKEELGQQVARHSFFRLSQPNIELARLILTDPLSAKLRQNVVDETVARVRILNRALDGYALQSRLDGSFAFLHLPRGWRASTFQRACEAEGILIRNADEYILADGRAPNAVRFGLNCRVPRAEFEQGCATLRRLLDAPPHEMGV